MAGIERTLGIIVSAATGARPGDQHLRHTRRWKPHVRLEPGVQLAVLRAESGLAVGTLESRHSSKISEAQSDATRLPFLLRQSTLCCKVGDCRVKLTRENREEPMRDWMRRIRGALGMGLTWAIGWALVGIGIGVSSLLLPFLPWDAFFQVFDAPLPALAVPGFIGGVLFSLVLGVAGRRRSFDELSLVRVGAWGALGGLLLSLVPATLVFLGLATPRPGLIVWQATAVIAVPLMLLSAASAVATLRLAQGTDGPPRLGSTDRQRLPGTTVRQEPASDMPRRDPGLPRTHTRRPSA